MKKSIKFYAAVLAAVLVLCPAAGFSAVEDAATEAAQAPDQTITGTIVSVQPDKNTMVFQYVTAGQGTAATALFHLAPTVSVTRNGAAVEGSSLKAGDNAVISYQTDESENRVVNTVMVQ